MVRVLPLFFFLLIYNASTCQELSLKRLVKTDSFKLEFYVAEGQKVYNHVNDSLYYHWYKTQKMYVTQGGIDGEVINGAFKKFYLTGQLAEKGSLYYGVKQGKWKTWYPNGNLKTIVEYRRGKKHGNVSCYTEGGVLIKTRKYKRGHVKERQDNILNVVLGRQPAEAGGTKKEKEAKREKKESDSAKKQEKKKITLKDRFNNESKSESD